MHGDTCLMVGAMMWHDCAVGIIPVAILVSNVVSGLGLDSQNAILWTYNNKITLVQGVRLIAAKRHSFQRVKHVKCIGQTGKCLEHNTLVTCGIKIFGLCGNHVCH